MQYAMAVLEASAPETKIAPAQLIEAKLKLQQQEDYKKLWHFWFQSSAGTVLVADADMLLVASALDADCLNELMLCIKVLEVQGVPRRGDGAEAGRLVGAEKLLEKDKLSGIFADASKQLTMA